VTPRGATRHQSPTNFRSAAPLRVLVVEDDASVAELICSALEAAGFPVAATADGPAALTALASVRPDVLLLDVLLPGMDGLDVCAQVRALGGAGPHLPVILLTALDRTVYEGLGQAAGADDFVGKPFDVAALTTKVQAWGNQARTVGPAQP
jgi:two-component system, OmpR family, response regulator ResD